MLTHIWMDKYKGTKGGDKLAIEVSKAIQFDCGQVDLIRSNTDVNYGDAKAPFPVTLLQFESPSGSEVSHILVLYKELADGTIVIQGTQKSSIGDTWSTTHPHMIRRDGEEWVFTALEVTNPFKLEVTQKFIEYIFYISRKFFKIIACSNVTIVDNPAPKFLNKKRIKAGKFPIFEHKTLVLKLDDEVRVTQDLGGTHASPRVHLRRGHIRTLASGKQVWVQPCVVGSGPGIITKDYKVVSSKKHPPSSSASL